MSSLIKCKKCGQEFNQSSNNESYCPSCMIGFYEDDESLVKIPNKGSEVNLDPNICCVCNKELENPTSICETCSEEVYKAFVEYMDEVMNNIDYESRRKYQFDMASNGGYLNMVGGNK